MLPATNPSAMRMVEWISVSGMAAWACPAAPATRRPAGIVTPRRVSRWRSRSRARASRPRTATSESPELMRRRGVGQPLQVAEHDRCAQPLGQTVDLLVEDFPIGIVLRSEDRFPRSARRRAGRAVRRRAAAPPARVATRCATPNSQLATDPLRRIDPARLARTRKTAWKASSASWASWRTPRQTRSTIGPCRITSSSKAASAASSRRETNRSRSCASDIVPTAPRLNSRCNEFASHRSDLLGDPSPPSSTRPAGDPHEDFGDFPDHARVTRSIVPATGRPSVRVGSGTTAGSRSAPSCSKG